MLQPLIAAAGGGGGSLPMIVLVLALVGFAAAYFIIRPGKNRKGPKRAGDIPLAMRPYHSDEELETTGMQRAMAWGVALAVFASLFLPLYWLIEPDRIDRSVDEMYEQDVQAGRDEYQNACASCHGVDLSGGSAPHPDQEIEAAWPAPALDNIVARYNESEVVPDVREFLELTLRHGRPGTPMEAFSVGSGGILSDNQIDQVIAYILSVQTGELPEAEEFEGALGEQAVVFENNCARCHGTDGEGYVGPQLQNVFERYGWDGEGDPTDDEGARAAIEQVIRDGRQVPGTSPMPDFDQTLTDEAIDAVIDHLESFQTTDGPNYGQVGGDPTASDEDEDEADADVDADDAADDVEVDL